MATYKELKALISTVSKDTTMEVEVNGKKTVKKGQDLKNFLISKLNKASEISIDTITEAEKETIKKSKKEIKDGNTL